MSGQRARASFVERGLAFEEGSLTLALNEAALTADVSLVIDVYDLGNESHPEGHVGWWKFALAALGEDRRVTIRVDGHGVAVTIGDVAPVESWRNPDRPGSGALDVIAVLRANTTNAIVSIDRVPAFPTAAGLAAYRAGFSRDWSTPRYAPATFVPGQGETVHLVSPSVHQRDGVGNLCLELYRLMRQNGVPVRLHATVCDPVVNDIAEPQEELGRKAAAGDRILYFYSTFDPLLPEIAELPVAHKAAYYHGITDPLLLRVFDPELSMASGKAIAALPILSRFDALAANSRHSAGILARALALPTERIGVIAPQLAAPGVFERPPHAERRNAMLAVAQLKPHKKIEDVLRLFAAYRALEESAECWIVGRNASRAYHDYLHWVQTRELGLPEGAVRWLGGVTDDELVSLYRTAGVLVSMSEDEGYCLPLVEAMQHGLPVVAHDLPAVAETLGGAGLRFGRKEFTHLAAALADLRRDAGRTAAIVEAQYRRVEAIQPHLWGAAFMRLLVP